MLDADGSEDELADEQRVVCDTLHVGGRIQTGDGGGRHVVYIRSQSAWVPLSAVDRWQDVRRELRGRLNPRTSKDTSRERHTTRYGACRLLISLTPSSPLAGRQQCHRHRHASGRNVLDRLRQTGDLATRR